MIGCAPTAQFLKSDFEKKQIKTIAIIPVVDRRTDDKDTVESQELMTDIGELLSEKIMDKDYDVVSSSSVNKIIKEKNISNMTPANLCSELKVDAVLFSNLFEYNDVFFINHKLNLNYKLYGADGASLWQNLSQGSSSPIFYFLGGALGWTIGISSNEQISSDNKSVAILAGVAGAAVGVVIGDALVDDISRYMDEGLMSLPDGKEEGKEIQQ
jgi:hypothetical protein